MPTDSPAAKQLKALRGRIPKLSVRKLAEALGVSHTSYAYYEDDFKHRHLPMDLVKKLAAEFVGKGQPPITQAEVMALGGVEPSVVNVTYADVERLIPAPPAVQGSGSWPRDIPILGVTVGGTDGTFQMNLGEVADFAKRPPAMPRVGKIFALYVQGSSMARWRQPGQLVYLDPVRPAKPGDHVVVECYPEREGDGHPAYLKEYVSRTATKIKLLQYNPEGTIEIPLSRVKHVHRVIEWEELLGV